MYQGAQRKTDEMHPQRRNDEPQQQPRRDQSFQNAPRPLDNVQGKRDQNRDPRGQQNRQPRVSNSGSQRVNDTDFPAMHMQGQRGQQNQNTVDNRRFNNPQRINPVVASQRSQQQFPQGRAAVDDIRNRIRQEERPTAPVQNQPTQTPVMDDVEPEIMDAQLVNEPTVAPIEEVAMPEEQNFSETPTDEIPDDWLMPKVFKSSKNNN